MTSKNSFLANSKENYKRRIWVLAVSILGQLVLYPGVLTVYLSRIRFWNADGVYNMPELYKMALQGAATDALGFQPFGAYLIMFLAILIAVQGFSYLYDRKKVDMYYSVPVSSKRRFVVIYVNGLMMYIIPALASILIAVIMAAVQGSLTIRGAAECGLAILFNLLYFLIVYHTAILAVMLTGNVVITGFAVFIFLFIGYVALVTGNALAGNFFKTKCPYFEESYLTGSIFVEYSVKVSSLKHASSLSEIVRNILPVYGKWFVSALLLLAFAYLCYRKRPAEAAGKAMAFSTLKPFVKIVVSVVTGLVAGWLIYDATCYNAWITALGMICGTLLCSIVMEAIYEADVRGVFRHLISTGIGAAAIGFIFCIFQFDLFGYDSYVPDADEVESVALDLGPYQNYWEWDDAAESVSYMMDSEYLRKHMFLTDVDAVCELARKSQGIYTDMEDRRGINVLYRLKSGKEVSRRFWVYFADETNRELLDRVIGTEAYRTGFYMISQENINTVISEMKREWGISYTNGAISTDLPVSESERLREMWLKDMEQFNFTMAGSEKPCGELSWQIINGHVRMELPVYESFTNTISVLEEYQAYYPVELRVEDILSMEVTNWHNQQENGTWTTYEAVRVDEPVSPVTAEFTDPEEIAQIAENIYPGSLDTFWMSNAFESGYEVVVTFKTDSAYPYNRGYTDYSFLSGQIPDFVLEKTAYGENN